MGNIMCNPEVVLAISKHAVKETAASEEKRQNEKDKKTYEKEYEAFELRKIYMSGSEECLSAKEWKEILNFVFLASSLTDKVSQFTKRDDCK